MTTKQEGGPQTGPAFFDLPRLSLFQAGFTGLNVAQVTGRGRRRGVTHQGRSGERHTVNMLPKIKLEVVVRDADTQRAIDIVMANARTGNIGDGKIFVSPVSDPYRVRTGEHGDEAL